MIKRFYILVALIALFSLKGLSQTFTYRTSLKDMCGDPGDIFTCTISFTNTSSSPINIFVNRYQKTTPAYWYSCFCYNQCNVPSRDTITINLPAFAIDMMAVQFKTDSVNPSLSDADFTIYQVGFQNNEDSFHIEASTVCNLAAGINEFSNNNNRFSVSPNPTAENITILSSNIDMQEIRIYNIVGELKENMMIGNLRDKTINLSGYDAGVYIVEISTSDKSFKQRFIKQ